MPGYKDEFMRAHERAKNFGLTVPDIEVRDGEHLLTQEFLRDFPHLIARNTNIQHPRDLAAQCFSINLMLREVISDHLKCPLYYTIGWVDVHGSRRLFHFDEEFVREALDGQVSTAGAVSLHAWLTLPTMEIIDPTLATSILLVNGREEGLGGVMAKFADDLTGLTLKPMLVGEDFLRRSGGLADFEFRDAG